MWSESESLKNAACLPKKVEARVKRLRNRMGVLEGRARVGPRVVANGSMTFALGTKDSGNE